MIKNRYFSPIAANPLTFILKQKKKLFWEQRISRRLIIVFLNFISKNIYGHER